MADLSRYVQLTLPGVPSCFNVVAYGTRVAADQDALVLNVPTAIHDRIFWWAPQAPDMRTYYGGVNALNIFRFSVARAAIRYTYILPGVFTARTPAPIDWSTIGPDITLPQLAVADIDATWAAAGVSPSRRHSRPRSETDSE